MAPGVVSQGAQGCSSVSWSLNPAFALPQVETKPPLSPHLCAGLRPVGSVLGCPGGGRGWEGAREEGWDVAAAVGCGAEVEGCVVEAGVYVWISL